MEKNHIDTTIFRVSGMDCENEVSAINKVAARFPEIKSISPNITSGKVTVTHTKNLDLSLLAKAIETAGVKVITTSDEGTHDHSQETISKNRILIVVTSGILCGLGFAARWIGVEADLAVNSLFVVSALTAGTLVFPKAYQALLRKQLEINVLMAVAVLGAFIIKEYAEAATVVFLFALSELLESYSVGRARKAIQMLMKLTPETALKLFNGVPRELPVTEIKIGDLVLIKAGARIPVDGEVIEGQSDINQAPLTGESMPVQKNIGSQVFAGTINGDGSLKLKTTRLSTESKISKIIEVVEKAQEKKAPTQRFVDTFAKYYTPAVFIAAILVFLVGQFFIDGDTSKWFYRSLVLLVIACPCALVIATPVSVVSALAAMARQGVLIKGGTYLETIGKMTALALDKTGTITEGNPKVLSVIPKGRYSEDEVISIAAGINANSTHPLAKAILGFAKDKNVSLARVENFKAVQGKGAQGYIDNELYFIGNHRFAHETGVCSPQTETELKIIEEKAQTAVVVAKNPSSSSSGEVIGIIGIGDSIRSEAKTAIAALHKVGIKQVVMLSGDNQRTVDVIAKSVGIDKGLGDLLPEDKVKHLKELFGSNKIVGMVGDGVNDAPAMAEASIGIAMGAAGTDTAIETADVALMQDNLERIADAIKLGKRTLAIIRFNVGFALTTKAIFLGLGFFGYTSLWLAIAADTGATLLVVANSLRLLGSSKTATEIS